MPLKRPGAGLQLVLIPALHDPFRRYFTLEIVELVLEVENDGLGDVIPINHVREFQLCPVPLFGHE
jgi:hypothetical protein